MRANYEEVIKTKEYDFLRTDPRLGKNIILLGLGGSHAYGTNIEGSDLDIRGIATHTAEEILTGTGFEQVTDNTTDTVIYSLKKIVSLLVNCNPNTIEMLGLEPDQYLLLTDAGRLLIENRHLFLSKRAVRSFGGYANSQLWRLRQKSIRSAEQEDQERHILNSIESARYSFPEKYFKHPEDAIRLYIDDAVNEEYDKEIFLDVCLHHYPLRDYTGMWEEMQHIARSYKTIGKRNNNAIEHGKISKHMMHLVRLYLMAFDILEKGEIRTRRRGIDANGDVIDPGREREHEFLMDIRAGKYLRDDQPTPEFYNTVREYEHRLKKAAARSKLPQDPDMEKINKLIADINRKIVESQL